MELNSAVNLSSSNLCTWSPNGRYLAVVTSKSRLVIRDSADLQVIRSEVVLFSSSGVQDTAIEKVSFSPDSEFVLAASFKAATTFVFRVLHGDWKAKIWEGGAGLEEVRFAPDSRHILAFSQYRIKVTIWSLCEKRVRYIKFPQCAQFAPTTANEDNGQQFSSGGGKPKKKRHTKIKTQIFFKDVSWQ